MDVLTLLAVLHTSALSILPLSPPKPFHFFLSSGLLKDKLIMSLLPTVTIKVASLAYLSISTKRLTAEQ